MSTLLQINITANWGSTGKIAEAIGATALAHGWDSYIAYGRWCNPSQSHLIKIGGWSDECFHYVQQRVLDNEGLCSRNATKRLIRAIDAIRPDVVQLHNIHGHYLNYRILFEYLNQSGIKAVWTFHDFWAFTGHYFHFVTKDCEKWKTGCFECPMRKLKEDGENYNLTLIGGGEQKEELQAMAEELGLTDIVWFYGPCYDEGQLGHLIYNADLCVSPGNVGLTAMHSMFFGTPVLTHNDFQWQMPEFEAIKEGETGGFFERDNVDSICSSVSGWFKVSGYDREQIRKNCFVEIDQNWTPQFQIEVLKKHLIGGKEVVF